jgi:hypothetical protein
MKVWMFVGICVLAPISCGADELLMPVSVTRDSQQPGISPEERKRILQQKTAELHQLQDEIVRLGGTISSPKKVRMAVRIVEIDAAKLKDHNLTNPLEFDSKNSTNSIGRIVTFESDKELLQGLEPLVAKGCAEIVFNPTVISSMGETTVLNCFRELPPSDDSIAANKQLDLLNGDAKIPGIGIQCRTTEDPDNGMLLVTLRFRVTEEDPANSVTLNGRTQPATLSRRTQSTINLKSGVTLVLGPLVTTVRTKSPIRPVADVAAPSNPDAGEPTSREMRFYTMITAERLPDDQSEQIAPR